MPLITTVIEDRGSARTIVTSIPNPTSSRTSSVTLPFATDALFETPRPPRDTKLWAIPVAICLAIFLILGIVIFVLWRKGKLGKLLSKKKWNPYVRQAKKERQAQRVAEEHAKGNVVDLPPLKKKEKNKAGKKKNDVDDGVVDMPEPVAGRDQGISR